MLVWLTLSAAAVDPGALTRVEAATRVLQQVRAGQANGSATAEEVYVWSVRVFEAERDAGVRDAARNHAARMHDLGVVVADMVAAGLAPTLQLDAVRYYETEAAGWAAGTPPAAPAPAPAPNAGPVPPAPPPAPAPGAGLEACFQSCDATYQTCATDAEHFRLGVGALAPNDADCTKKAELACGTGRNDTAATCRDQSVRSCQATRRAAECARAQTQCNAKCR